MLPFAAALSILGCEDAPKGAAPSAEGATPAASSSVAPTATASAGACTEAALEEELLGYCEAGLSSGPPGMAPLPWTMDPGKRPTEAIEIFVAKDRQLNIDGAVVSLKAFADVWPKKAKLRRQMLQGAKSTPWILAVAKKVDVATVARITKTLEANGDRRGHLAFTVPDHDGSLHAKPRDPEQLAALHAKIDSTDLNRKAAKLAVAIQRSKLKTCPPLVKVFGAIAGAAPDQKCRLLARGVAEAFPGCKCRHADEILTLLYAVMADTQPPKRRGAWVGVTLAPQAAPLEVKAGASWAEFSAQLERERLGNLHLVASDGE
jgi:hypothetical protein